MKKSLSVILSALALLPTLYSCKQQDPLSVRMIRSEISRCPDATFLDGRAGTPKWNYTTGLELLAFQDAARTYSLKDVDAYVRNWADLMNEGEGKIKTYKKSNYNVDHICPARIYFRLYDDALAKGDSLGASSYKAVLDSIRSQVESQPRTEAGAFWHKKIYPYQLWLDGLYMALPFYAQYTARFESDPAEADRCYRDIVHEFEVAADKTFDPATGLFRHAWDESRKMFWADPVTGQSAHAWGRADGWYAMALVEVLDIIPESHPGHKVLADQLEYLLGAVQKFADPATGMWYQVLDCPAREGNYLESTCSIMFVYAALKGVSKGWLDSAEWGTRSRQAYDSFVKTFIRENSDGTISMTSCCAVGGLGGKQMRSGDFDYYLSEPIVENDPKGVGPFIWASLIYEGQ